MKTEQEKTEERRYLFRMFILTNLVVVASSLPDFDVYVKLGFMFGLALILLIMDLFKGYSIEVKRDGVKT